MGLEIKGIKGIKIRRGDIVLMLMEGRRKIILGVGKEYTEWLIL